MKKINFQKFEMPDGIRQDSFKECDLRESFADVLFCKVNGIRALNLANKIFKSEGETEYDDQEVDVMEKIASLECTPQFYNGLLRILNNQK